MFFLFLYYSNLYNPLDSSMDFYILILETCCLISRQILYEVDVFQKTRLCKWNVERNARSLHRRQSSDLALHNLLQNKHLPHLLVAPLNPGSTKPMALAGRRLSLSTYLHAYAKITHHSSFCGAIEYCRALVHTSHNTCFLQYNLHSFL